MNTKVYFNMYNSYSQKKKYDTLINGGNLDGKYRKLRDRERKEQKNVEDRDTIYGIFFNHNA